MGTMYISLIEERTVIVNDQESYAACLYDGCSSPEHARMLCRKHYQQGNREGWLWQYPGDFTYDVDDEVQDTLDGIVRWACEFDFDTFVKIFEEVNNLEPGSAIGTVMFLTEPKGMRLRTSLGYHSIADGVCPECRKPFEDGRVEHSRGLCRACYMGIVKSKSPGRINSYPTKRYIENVAGHIWFVCKFFPRRVAQVAEDWGVLILPSTMEYAQMDKYDGFSR